MGWAARANPQSYEGRRKIARVIRRLKGLPADPTPREREVILQYKKFVTRIRITGEAMQEAMLQASDNRFYRQS